MLLSEADLGEVILILIDDIDDDIDEHYNDDEDGVMTMTMMILKGVGDADGTEEEAFESRGGEKVLNLISTTLSPLSSNATVLIDIDRFLYQRLNAHFSSLILIFQQTAWWKKVYRMCMLFIVLLNLDI